jgi:hypothetical protein
MTADTYVKVDGNFELIRNIWLKADGNWEQVKNSWVNVNGTWQQVYSIYFVYNYSLAASTYDVDFNLMTAATTAGWDGTKPLLANIAINGVLGSAVHGYGFDTGAIPATINSLPNIITVTVASGAYITGAGGSARGAGPSHAVNAQTPIYIVNNGIIQGGGNSGGGANDSAGGAGYYAGSPNGTGGGATLNSGGAGGYNSAPKSANGNPGGGPGGTTAIVGYSNVTYSGNGTIKGGTQ